MLSENLKSNIEDKLIVALDYNNLKKAEELVDKLYPVVKHFKVGSELFSAAGPDAVKMVNGKGGSTFLDLKFCDIPNTVSKAIEAIAKLNPFMFNVHASGGPDMLKGAVAAVESLDIEKKPILLAVTVLTSIDKKALRQLGITRSPAKQVLYLAKLAKETGVDGVVCSPMETEEVRRVCGKDFVIVTPGIRSAGEETPDQKRTATPAEAIKRGADYIVVGRPITKADNPKEAAKQILEQICQAKKKN